MVVIFLLPYLLPAELSSYDYYCYTNGVRNKEDNEELNEDSSHGVLEMRAQKLF